jgi:hypothetical protein
MLLFLLFLHHVFVVTIMCLSLVPSLREEPNLYTLYAVVPADGCVHIHYACVLILFPLSSSVLTDYFYTPCVIA